MNDINELKALIRDIATRLIGVTPEQLDESSFHIYVKLKRAGILTIDQDNEIVRTLENI